MSFFISQKQKLSLCIIGLAFLSSSSLLGCNPSFSAAKQPVQTSGKVQQVAKAPIPKEQPAPSPWESSLQARLQGLLEHDLTQRSQVSLLVYDLTAQKTLFSYRPKQLLRPASTMKSLVALTALDKLSIYHQFTTKLAYDGTIRNGVLTGNIY